MARKTTPPARKTRARAPAPAPPAPWVCNSCLKDPYLHHIAAASQAKHACLACGRIRKGMPLADLTSRVEKMLSAHYHPAPNEPEGLEYFVYREQGYWDPPGQPLEDVLAEELGTSEEVVAAVCDELTEREGGHRHVAQGGELFYRPEQHFVLGVLLPDVRRHDAFRAFQHRLRYEARWFHPEHRALLASIFDNVDQLVTEKGTPVVVEVNPGDRLALLQRARTVQWDAELEKVLVAPERELGSPPADIARANRMNAANVSVFYGASTSATALAEVRPPAYSRVVVGAFELVRPVRLLDVAALTRVAVQGSKFDPEHVALGQHAQLLQIVSWRISQPVLPDHQDGSYLVTQAIADYLAYECAPAFDGMVFPSTQTVDGGENVVLFHPAARCEIPEVPANVTLHADLESDTEDGPEPDYTVRQVANDPHASPPMPQPEAVPDKRPVTLRLRRDTLTVHHVRPVAVTTVDYPVRWYSYDASEPTDF